MVGLPVSRQTLLLPLQEVGSVMVPDSMLSYDTKGPDNERERKRKAKMKKKSWQGIGSEKMRNKKSDMNERKRKARTAQARQSLCVAENHIATNVLQEFLARWIFLLNPSDLEAKNLSLYPPRRATAELYQALVEAGGRIGRHRFLALFLVILNSHV